MIFSMNQKLKCDRVENHLAAVVSHGPQLAMHAISVALLTGMSGTPVRIGARRLRIERENHSRRRWRSLGLPGCKPDRYCSAVNLCAKTPSLTPVMLWIGNGYKVDQENQF